MPPGFRRSSGLKGTRRVRRTIRKRASVRTRARWQAPTAHNQKRQIQDVAMQVSKNTRFINRHRIYTDWQYSDQVGIGAISPGWGVVELTNFSNWNAVLRQSESVDNASHTFVQRMQMNLRMTLNDADFCSMNCFIVTLRKDAAGKDPFLIPPIITEEWIQPSTFQGFNIRLNSAYYKVHWSQYATLSKGPFNAAPTALTGAGNPYSTWRKTQVNLPLKMSVTKPTLLGGSDSWKTKEFQDLPYNQKYFLFVYILSSGGPTRPSVDFDSQFVCLNSD